MNWLLGNGLSNASLLGFGLHGWEFLIVGLVILLLFGNRLPALMRSLGRSVVEFKQGVREIDEDKADDEEAEDQQKRNTVAKGRG